MPAVDLPPIPDTRGLRLSPTDISQFIRLEQCERYLRLRLHARAEGESFLRDSGVTPQSIPPLLTRSGRVFEESVEARLVARFRTDHLARDPGDPARQPDNARVLQAARGLLLGEVLVLLQPRLREELEGWALTGDADLLRLERLPDGSLDLMITDLKSSMTAKVEHRLQVAFYHAMLARLCEREGLQEVRIRTAILYRGAPDDDEQLTAEARAEQEEHRESARAVLGLEGELLEVVDDPDAYLDTVRDLVTGPASLARTVAARAFADVPFHLTYKCDGCLYNEYCLKWAAEQDDLSLIPHLSAGDKSALRRNGVVTVKELASLKKLGDGSWEIGDGGGAPAARSADLGSPVRAPSPSPIPHLLSPSPGNEDRCKRLATTWPVGPRIDELIHRARRYRKWKGDSLECLSFIPSKGYGSLPYCDAAQNPNLVRVYLDAQHDYLHDRIYLLGARVVGCAGGVPARHQSIVHLTEGPPDNAEKERRLFVRWIRDLLRAVVECAAPDEQGEARAPVHLIFYNRFEQRLLLEGLSRHFTRILGSAPALYDFMTQLAAFDSPIATFLDEEIRELKNYPMVCQSLQAVAAFLKFKWDEPEPFTEQFRARLFDEWRKHDTEETTRWFTGRARFNSQIPLEYAYAAWGELEPTTTKKDDYAAYRTATPELLAWFQARRLEALEHVTADFRGNPLTTKNSFLLPELAEFTDTARSLAQALDEFVTIERHVELDAWKQTRHLPPERRALLGETLVVRYVEEDQAPGVAELNREHERRRRLREIYEAEFRETNPDARLALTKAQRDETKWEVDGFRVRLRLETDGLECSLDELLGLITLQPGDRFVLNLRWTADERLPEAERTPFMPTPKQMLYGLRADFRRLDVEPDEQGRVRAAWIEVELAEARGGSWSRGFVFSTFPRRTLKAGEAYTLDPCPNNWYGYWCSVITQGLRELDAGGDPIPNALYERVRTMGAGEVRWPAAAAKGQARFLAGLDAFHAAGLFHPFEESKRDYLGRFGEAPLLVVQGPPGTGKSYSTGFALFARMQGALAVEQPFRAVVSCKTHAATDVLLANVLGVQQKLLRMHAEHPVLFAEYFDERLLYVPLYRLAGKNESPEGIVPLPKDRDLEKGQPKNANRLLAERYCVLGATPGGIYGAVKARWDKELFGHTFCECLVLDEASQMNLPEAVMAALPLALDGQLIVVGDHRQMPPIVKHDWDNESRRTFQEYRAYESLFETLLPLDPPVIRFAESFRLHHDMAAFLREEIYRRDGIPYHSRRADLLPDLLHDDPFVRAVLSPTHPLVVVVHEESESQARNPYEQSLISPLLEALSDPARYGLDAVDGLGVVVPHRAQRAALQNAFPILCVRDPESGSLLRSAVDTVERFQGGERTAILVSATESDREYLLPSSDFLLDPRRLTVAMSRAKRKLVLVASRSVFTLFSPDEETFQHSQLWKNLLRRTCTELLWVGEREGKQVEVWGNQDPRSI